MLNFFFKFPVFIFFKKYLKISKYKSSFSSNLFFNFLKNTKVNFFNSIKKFFFFSKKSIRFIKKKELFTRKFRSFYFNYNLITSSFTKRKKKMFFFDQRSIFLDRKINLKFYLLWAFPSKLINERFFFKKCKIESVLLKTYFHRDLILNNFSRFINFKFSKKYSCYNITINNNFVENFNVVLKVGDTIKFFFSNKFIFFFLKSEVRKFLNFFKIKCSRKKKIKVIKGAYKAKFFKKNFIKYADLSTYGFDTSFLNFSSVKIFRTNTYFTNFFFQQYLNLFSWRLYEWDRK